MNKTLLAVVVCVGFAGCGGSKGEMGAAGPAGPTGSMGTMGTAGMDFVAGPSISLVSPNKLVVGRATEVSISGFATKWTATAKVSFGAGVTVSNIRVASQTAIVADIAVDGTAMLGTRDITVTQGSDVASYTGVFAVLPVYKVTLPTKATLGAVFAIRVHHNDPTFSFGTTPAITITPAPVMADVHAFTSTLTPQDLVVQFFADLTAPLGKRAVRIVSNAGAANELQIDIPDAFDLLDKVEVPLVDGTPSTGTLVDASSGVLFKYVPTASELRIFAMSTGGGKSFIFVLPATGKFSGLLQSGATVLTACPPVEGCYVSAFDLSGKAGLMYSMTVTAPPGGPEVEPNDTLGAPQVLMLSLVGGVPTTYVTAAELGSLADQDWFKVTVTAAEVGKKFHVVTSPGDMTADPVVDVQTSAGVSMGGPSDDSSYHEDFRSTSIPAAGDYFIKVLNSTFVSMYDPTRSHYVLAITVE